MKSILLVLLAGCIESPLGEPLGETLPYFDQVYVCDTEAGEVEVCYDKGVSRLEETIYGACHPTDRHIGPCVYKCPSARGCNALHGCWCPPEAD